MRQFSIFKRKGQRFYYAQIKNPDTGKYLPPRSTKMTDRTEAVLVVAGWLQNGIPERNGSKRPVDSEVALHTVLTTIRSTDFTDRDVDRIISALQDRGLVVAAVPVATDPDSHLLLPYLELFWDYDRSPYVREKLAYGQSIGRRHCYEQTRRLQHWRSHFEEGTHLKQVNRDNLREFQLALKEKGLAAKTVNAIISAGTVG